jgi:hypothetical protein
MKIVKRILLGLLVLLVVLLVVGFFLPGRYRVERSTVMHATTEAIFPYVNTLKRWPDWTAWNTKKYPDMKVEFEGPEAGKGATYRWDGKDVGKGSLTLTSSDPERGVEYDLNFENGKYLSKGALQFEPMTEGVKVTFRNEGDLGWSPISRYFGLMMDRFMGPDFEEGLANLKTTVEAR